MWGTHPPHLRGESSIAPTTPIAYLIYCLIHGAVTNWCPYWFIDPAKSPGGWTGVVVYSSAITVGFLAVSFILLWLGNKLKRNVV